MPRVIKVGMVTSHSGALSEFGSSDAWVVEQMTAWFEENPIEAGGSLYTVETIVKDAQSDTTRAGQLADELINADGVDLVVAQGTPDIVNPVADACEANATPCLTAGVPWQTYYFSRQKDPVNPESFAYTFHFAWGLEDVSTVFQDMWNQLPTNKKVGGLFPDDFDGRMWAINFPDMLTDQGYTIDAPPLYVTGTQEFASQIARYKQNEDEILTGTPLAADFITFWTEATRQGYAPKAASISKALMFPSSVEAIGDTAENLSTEVTWSPTVPFTSSLTGLTARELADAWTKDSGKQWTQPTGFVEALYEVLNAAVIAAGGPDKESIATAMATLQVSTIVGDLHWGTGPVPNVAKTPLSGGQWRKTEGGQFPWDLVIVANPENPDQPLGGKMEPLD